MRDLTTKRKLRKVGKFHEGGILAVLMLLCVIIGCINPVFFSSDNLINLLRQTSYVIIVGCITTMVIIIGGLDLSLGSVIGLSGIAVAMFLKAGVPIVISIILAMGVASLIGGLNGLLIVKVKVPAFIATLGTMYIARGICNALTKGVPVYPLPQAFGLIGNGTLLRIPYSVYFVAVCALVVHFVLKNTTFGRSVYAIGGNEETAMLSGLRVDRIKIIVYILSSISAAIAGIIMTSRITSAQTSLGEGWEMTVISSVIIGGTSMMGGSGTVLGTVLGALLTQVISNGMIIMNVSVYWQSIVVGVIIIAAVVIDIIRKKRAGLN